MELEPATRSLSVPGNAFHAVFPSTISHQPPIPSSLLMSLSFIGNLVLGQLWPTSARQPRLIVADVYSISLDEGNKLFMAGWKRMRRGKPTEQGQVIGVDFGQLPRTTDQQHHTVDLIHFSVLFYIDSGNKTAARLTTRINFLSMPSTFWAAIIIILLFEFYFSHLKQDFLPFIVVISQRLLGL